MALPGTHELTVDLVDIAGIDTPGIGVFVEKATPRLIYPVGPDAPTRETLYPTQLQKKTDAAGVARFDLLPSSVAGPYKVTIGNYERTISMPAAAARLANLEDVDPDASGEPDTASSFLHTDMRNLDGDLTDEEKAAIAGKILDLHTGSSLTGDGSEDNPFNIAEDGVTFDELDDGIGAAIRAADNRDGSSRRITGNRNRVWETDEHGTPGWRAGAASGRAPVPATNDLVDQVAQTGRALSASLASPGTLDDVGFLTTRKAVRLLQRVLKTASTTLAGVVLLARNADLDEGNGAETGRVTTVAGVKRMILRIGDAMARSAAAAARAVADAALPLAGGTMTGRLILAGAPTADNEAATKAYVDERAAAGPTPGNYHIGWSDAALPTDAELAQWRGVNAFNLPIPARPEADGNGHVGFAVPAAHDDPIEAHLSNNPTFNMLPLFVRRPDRSIGGAGQKVWTSETIWDRAVYGVSGAPVHLLLRF